MIFFSDVGFEIVSKINNQNINIRESCSVEHNLFLNPVNTSEINKHINNLKNTSSCGRDRISVRLIKVCYEYVNRPMVHIINTIFESGIVPDHFKESIVSPVYKSGNRTEKTNYRPISVVNNFSKIFEKALKCRLQEFLNKYNIISNNQFGFKTNSSTNDAIYKLTSTVNKYLHENKKCIAVFLDLAKAFDTVSHEKLLLKLENIGIRGNVLSVFASYLSGRIQYVKIRNTLSQGQTVKMGIPQGTIIAPLLFIIYMNQLCSMDISGHLISYADDTAIIVAGDSWTDARIKVARDMEEIMNWLNYNLLSLNVDKTKFMTFSIYNSHLPNIKDITLQDGSKTITAVDKIKYLGITVDKNFNWMEHVLSLTNKMRKMISKFYILRDILCRGTILQVYQALVVSSIRYGIIAWGGAYQNVIKSLSIIQKRIIKVIYKQPIMYPTADLYSENNILDINGIYFVESVLFVAQRLSMFKIVSHSHNTRAVVNRNIDIETFFKSKQHNFIDYLGPLYYNMLPNQIRSCENKKRLRRQVIEFVLRKNDNR